MHAYYIYTISRFIHTIHACCGWAVSGLWSLDLLLYDLHLLAFLMSNK